MLIEAIKGLDMTNVSKICIVGLLEHDKTYQLVEALSVQLADLGLLERTTFVLLEAPTKNQPETVAEGIKRAGIDGQIYIKDSDNFFVDCPVVGNQIAAYDLHHIEKVNARGKSYVESNADGYITNIVEKRIVGSKFCVGGYSFESAREYLEKYEELAINSDLYLSHIIFGMILDGKSFKLKDVKGYLDWGTLREWEEFTRQFCTLFIDLDGTLVYNSAQYSRPKWGETDGILPNILASNRLFDSGKVQVIITTSRKENFREQTQKQLEKIGIKYHSIIFGLPHGRRIVINDYSPTNRFKSCDAINIRRDSSELKEMLEDSIGFFL